MKESLQEQLVKHFPDLCTENQRVLRFECADGWFELIYNLFNDIEEYVVHNREVHPELGIEWPRITTVKEKFGTLRIYATHVDDWIEKRIIETEDNSYKICERCGSTDHVKQVSDGWISTLCQKCRKNKLE